MNEQFSPPQPQPSPTDSQGKPPRQNRQDCNFCPISRQMAFTFCSACGKQLAPIMKQPTLSDLPAQTEPSVEPDAGQDVVQHPPDPSPPPPPAEPQDEDCTEADAQDETCQVQADTASQPAEDDQDQGIPPEAHFCLSCTNCMHRTPPKYRLAKRRPDKTYDAGQPFVDELTIGKLPECELVIPDDDFVSRRHARIFRSDGLLFLEDLGSSNGCFLRIRRPIVLEAGDEIVIGTNVLRLEQD